MNNVFIGKPIKSFKDLWEFVGITKFVLPPYSFHQQVNKIYIFYMALKCIKHPISFILQKRNIVDSSICLGRDPKNHHQPDSHHIKLTNLRVIQGHPGCCPGLPPTGFRTSKCCNFRHDSKTGAARPIGMKSKGTFG